MKKVKKGIAVLFAAMIVGTLMAPAMAAPAQDALGEGGMAETVHSDGVIFRTFVGNASANNDAQDEEKTKEALKQLGLDGRAVENMDAEALAELAACPALSSAIAYYQISRTGKGQIVEEGAALAAAERAANAGSPLFGSKFGGSQYVKVVVISGKTAPVEGQNAYLIHGTFTWLTEPKFGGNEFFGIGSANCTFASEDASGYVSWRHKKYQNDGTVISDAVESPPQEPKLETSKAGDAAIGYEFSLPVTRYAVTTGRKTDEYSQWFGYISAKGVIRSLQEEHFYNSATYLHQSMLLAPPMMFSPPKAHAALSASVQQSK